MASAQEIATTHEEVHKKVGLKDEVEVKEEPNKTITPPSGSAQEIDGRPKAEFHDAPTPAEPAAAHPRPPYTADTDCIRGIKCYYPGCNTTCDTWLIIGNHIKTRHAAKLQHYTSTYLHKNIVGKQHLTYL